MKQIRKVKTITTEPTFGVVDSLNSTSTTDSLSANMGRELNEKINNLDLTSSGSNLDVYSTEEQVVGTWINGKPIYRKSYELSTGSSAGGTQYYDIGAENIGLVTSVHGTCYWGSGNDGSTMIPFRNSDNDYCKLWCADNVNTKKRNIIIQSSNANRLVYVHIEYTKTTD